MITKNKTNISIVAGETDVVLQDGALNDPTDNTNGMTCITGSWFMADGTNGALVYVKVSSVGGTPGVITQLEVQALFGGVAQTVWTFPGLTINAVGVYIFQIQPAGGAGNFAGSVQGAMPNQGQLRLTLANKDDAISASVGVQSTW